MYDIQLHDHIFLVQLLALKIGTRYMYVYVHRIHNTGLHLRENIFLVQLPTLKPSSILFNPLELLNPLKLLNPLQPSPTLETKVLFRAGGFR